MNISIYYFHSLDACPHVPYCSRESVIVCVTYQYNCQLTHSPLPTHNVCLFYAGYLKMRPFILGSYVQVYVV